MRGLPGACVTWPMNPTMPWTLQLPSEAGILMLNLAAAALLGYLLGAIPFGFIFGRLWGIDVREHESGRTGATNVWRASGKLWPAALTLVADAAKGVIAVLMARWLLHPAAAVGALAGIGAVYGHIWPVFLRFRGGAGGGTAAITQIVLNPIIGIPSLLIALYVIAFSRFASLGTLTVGVAGVVFSILLWLLRPDLTSPWNIVFAVMVTVAMIVTLQPNLRRLRQGTERRITLW